MGLFERWRGRPISLMDGEFWKGFFGLGTTSGEKVDFATTMGLDTAWSCVNLYYRTVGTLPCVVYEKDGSTISYGNPLYELLHDMPNLDDTASEFWGMAALCLLFDGNFFAEKKMNGARLVSLIPFNPLCVDVCRDSRNQRYYEVTEDGKKRKIAEEMMFHVRGARLPGCDRGMSPIAVVRNTLGNALASEKVAGKWFANGMMSSLILTSANILTASQRNQIGDTLKAFAGSERAGKVAVLEAGLTPHQLTINPQDAQMLETRKFSVEQICRIFGVPPVMIGHAAEGVTTWGSGVEQIILQFTKTGLRPMLKNIEAAIYRDLLDAKSRKEVKVEFNMEGFLRGDHAARMAFLTGMVDHGIYTHNEARAYENKPRMDGGDQLVTNSTMAPLTSLGKTAAVPPPRVTQ